MTSRPYLKWFPADYARDTRDLDWLQHGAYRLLIDACWDDPDNSLPSDLVALRRRLPAVDLRVFNRVVPPLLERYFVLKEGGRWVHKRLLKDAQNLAKSSLKQSEKAKKRWENKEPTMPGLSLTRIQTPDIKEETPPVCPPLGDRPKKKPTKVPLPEDFAPHHKTAEGLGWDAGRIERELQRFKDRALATAAVYANWQSAWNNWCTSPYQEPVARPGESRHGAGANGGGTHGGRRAGGIIDAIDNLQNRLRNEIIANKEPLDYEPRPDDFLGVPQRRLRGL